MTAFLERLTGTTLLDPGFLWLGLLAPVALWLTWRAAPAVLFGPGAFLDTSAEGGDRLPRSWRVRLLPLGGILCALGILCLVVALARPAHRRPLPLKSEGIDILLCLDTSSSMLSTDMDRQRTRLEVARDAAVRFIQDRPEDRIGLLSFARYPDLRCPLTLDHAALERILKGIATVDGDGPEDATGIGTAVARAAAVLEASGARSRVVILLTDGEENVALSGSRDEIPPAHAAQLCERFGVRVYPIVAGVGRRVPSGEIKKIDTMPVERMARRTGGAFFRARDAGAIQSVYARIDALEKAPFERPRFVVEDRYLGFLIAGLVLLLLARLLRTTVLAVLP